MKASWGRGGVVDRHQSNYIKTVNLEKGSLMPLISFSEA